MLSKKAIIADIAAAKGVSSVSQNPVPPLVDAKFIVVYTVRGWEFKTDSMSIDACNRCLKDFQYANHDIQFAAVIRPV